MQSVKMFFILNVLNISVGLLITLLNLAVLTPSEYGTLTEFLVILSYFSIATLGIQDGIKIKIRENNNYLNFFKFKLVVIFLVQMAIAIVIGIISSDILMFFVVITFPVNNMVGVFRQTILGYKKINFFVLIDMVLKIVQLIAILLIFIFNLSIYSLLIFNFLGRIFQVLFEIYIYYKYLPKNTEKISIKDAFNEMKNEIFLGLSITIAMWIINFCLNFDILYLRNSSELGYYSQSKSISLMILMFITPLSSYFFSTLPQKIDFNMNNNMIKILFALTSICSVAFSIAFSYFVTLGESIIFTEYTFYIVLVLPMITIINLLIVNALTIYFKSKFTLISILYLIITVITYYIISVFSNDITTVFISNIIVYTLFYLIGIKFICSKKQFFRNTIFVIIYIVCYILSLKFNIIGIFFIIVLLLLLNNWRKHVPN